jgi:imidazolonepropionase-like amidohydrolase
LVPVAAALSLRDLPNGDVLVRDDLIAAVGRNLSTSTRDADVLDCDDSINVSCLK